LPRLSRRAQKDLDQLPPPLAEKARELIRRLDDEPGLGKKLKGPLADKRSARLGRTHRILYETDEASVVVLTIVARKDAYR